MLTHEPTLEMVEKWKKLFNEYRDKLYPNKKLAIEIIECLKHRYVIKYKIKILLYNYTITL